MVIGLAGAIAGGAMKGWSEGTLAGIKAKREEKLKMLDMEFQRSENVLTRGVQREEIAARERQSQAQLASQEKMTTATLGVQKTIAEGQQATQRSIAELGEAGATGRTKMTIEAQQKIADLQAQTQLDLNIKPVLQEDGSTILMRGNEVIHVYDPKTGKEISPAATSTDTDQMRNYKFLAGIGTDKNLARDIAFDTGRDAAELKVSLYNNLLKTRVGEFGGAADEEDEAWARNKMQEVWGTVKPTPPPAAAETPEAPAAGDPNAAAPAVPTSSGAADRAAEPAIEIPAGWNKARLKAEVDAAIQKGIPRAKLRAAVRAAGRDPADAGL